MAYNLDELNREIARKEAGLPPLKKKWVTSESRIFLMILLTYPMGMLLMLAFSPALPTAPISSWGWPILIHALVSQYLLYTVESNYIIWVVSPYIAMGLLFILMI